MPKQDKVQRINQRRTRPTDVLGVPGVGATFVPPGDITTGTENSVGATHTHKLDVELLELGHIVLLVAADGSMVDYGVATDDGLTSALAAISSGDVVKLPPCSISGAHTVPDSGTLEGYGEASVLTGALTLGAGARAQSLQVLLSEDDAGEIVGVTTSGSGDPALLRDCRIDVTNATGDVAAVKPGTVELHVRNCDTRAVSGSGDSYHYAAGEANLYVEGGTMLDVILSTAPVKEV